MLVTGSGLGQGSGDVTLKGQALWVRRLKTERDTGPPAPTLGQPLLASVLHKHSWSAVVCPPGPDNAVRKQDMPVNNH